MSLPRPEKAFHQKSVPLTGPRKLAHSPINILKRINDEEEAACRKILGMIR